LTGSLRRTGFYGIKVKQDPSQANKNPGRHNLSAEKLGVFPFNARGDLKLPFTSYNGNY